MNAGTKVPLPQPELAIATKSANCLVQNVCILSAWYLEGLELVQN